MMLKVEEYLQSPPTWGRDGATDRYADALAALGLVRGRNPSPRCPEGGHEESTDKNVVVYAGGLMCYSRHGFISRGRVIELAGLPAATDGFSLSALAEREVGRFVAFDQLQSLLSAAVEERLLWHGTQQGTAVECLIRWATRVNQADDFWAQRLAGVCHGDYPAHAREFWSIDRIVHRQHVVPSRLEDLGRPGQWSYEVEIASPREKPSSPLAVALAPLLANVALDRSGALKAGCSAGTDRFLAGQKDAVARSSLVAIECLDRPVPFMTGGWRIPTDATQLPLFITVAEPSAKNVNGGPLIRDFFEDMKATFAFIDHEAFVRAVTYLIQPMLNVLMPGQFPGFLFSGPTKSGKTFLAGPLPADIYLHNAGQSVFMTRIPDNSYEMAVQLAAHRGVLYAVFDEAIDMTEEQLKILDQMVTAQTLVSRVMRVGYLTRPNHLTFAITAVSKSLPPESAGRILEIHLTESRPAEIEQFNTRWRGRGPEILRALFDAIRQGPHIRCGDPVPERRPGFGVLKGVLSEAFQLNARFEVAAAEDDVLDVVCLACSQTLGTARTGGWRRVSFQALATAYSQQTGLKASKRTMERRVYTALGYGSTRKHPVYNKTGYRWEDGRFYDIEIRKEAEGGEQERTSVYVRERKGAPPISASATAATLKTVPADPPDKATAAPADPLADNVSGTVEYNLAALEGEILGSESGNA